MSRAPVRYAVIIGVLTMGSAGCGRDSGSGSAPDPTALAASTLLEHLHYRAKTGRNTFDPAMRELTKVVCHASPETAARIDGAAIDELFPLDRVKEAERAGCGFLVTDAGDVYGRALRVAPP